MATSTPQHQVQPVEPPIHSHLDLSNIAASLVKVFKINGIISAYYLFSLVAHDLYFD